MANIRTSTHFPTQVIPCERCTREDGRPYVVYLNEDSVLTIRATDVYFSPATKPVEEHVKMLTYQTPRAYFLGQLLGHPLVGGLNRRSL